MVEKYDKPLPEEEALVQQMDQMGSPSSSFRPEEHAEWSVVILPDNNETSDVKPTITDAKSMMAALAKKEADSVMVSPPQDVRQLLSLLASQGLVQVLDATGTVGRAGQSGIQQLTVPDALKELSFAPPQPEDADPDEGKDPPEPEPDDA